MELAPGTSVDKFVVEDLLGRGGMASVYRIRHRDLNVAYALKIMHVTHPDLAGRIRSEGALQAELRHPNIVTVFDLIEVGGVPALVMELVDGPSLAALLDVHRPTLEQIDDIARGVLKGVRAAHTGGLIHRDLKPANVLMAHADDGYLPKITDFGLAKMLAGSASAVQTRTGAVMGTPQYMAPEQFRNSRAVDARADVYALGVMFYELAAGRRPYDAEDLFDLLDAVRNADYPRVTELYPAIPDRMADAIEGAMMVDPDERIPDIETLYQVWCGKVRVESSQIWDRSLLKQIGDSLSVAPVDIATGIPRAPTPVQPAVAPPPMTVEAEPSEEPETPPQSEERTRFEMRPRLEELVGNNEAAQIPRPPPLPDAILLSTRTIAPDALPQSTTNLELLDPPLDGSLETRIEPRPPVPRADSTPSLHLPPRPASAAPPALLAASSPGIAAPPPPVAEPPARRSAAPLLVLPALVGLVGIGFALLVVVVGATTLWMQPAGTPESALPPIELLPTPETPDVAPEPVVEVPLPEPPPETVPDAAPQPVKPSPRPKPKPVVTTKGKVRLTGDATTVRLVGADGKVYGPGAVPAGDYTLRAVFSDQGEVAQAVTVTVRADQETVIHCKSGFYSCTVK